MLLFCLSFPAALTFVSGFLSSSIVSDGSLPLRTVKPEPEI